MRANLARRSAIVSFSWIVDRRRGVLAGEGVGTPHEVGDPDSPRGGPKMTPRGKPLCSTPPGGARASVWSALRPGAEPRPPAAQLTTSQRAELVQPPPAPKVEPRAVEHE